MRLERETAEKAAGEERLRLERETAEKAAEGERLRLEREAAEKAELCLQKKRAKRAQEIMRRSADQKMRKQKEKKGGGLVILKARYGKNLCETMSYKDKALAYETLDKWSKKLLRHRVLTP